MIDNSSSMQMSQDNLQRNFGSFIDALENLPGGVPDLHLAVITSDMGAGDGTVSGCSQFGGDNGLFKSTPGAGSACTSTGLALGETFIRSTGGANPSNNFTGDIATVFGCIATVGATGCGFEQQLAAVSRALGADGSPPPLENAGFLRDDAGLVIVLVTNEDDCSAPNAFFDASENLTLASTLGPPSSYRCNEFGHLCDGARPARNAPTGQVTDTVSYASCVPAEDAGRLTPVKTFVTQIKSLKANPGGQILVATLQGPTTPYQVHWRMSPTSPPDGLWPEITHSCMASDGSFADPGIRLQRFIEGFGANGFQFSICADSYAPALAIVADRLGQLIGP
jgi:hypothetical protein